MIRTPPDISMQINEHSSGTSEMSQTTDELLLEVVSSIEAQQITSSSVGTVPKPSNATKSLALTTPPPKKIYKSRLDEAKACLTKAMIHLGESRNLRSDIKTGVTKAVERLYQLVKEAEKGTPICNNIVEKDPMKEIVVVEPPQVTSLLASLAEHSALVKDSNARMEKLQEIIEHQKEALAEVTSHSVEILEEKLIQLTENKIPGPLSYAEITARRLPTKHTIIVSSEEAKDTSEDVLNKIRGAVDARNTGIQVSGVRKARNQKVLISCEDKDDLTKITDHIKKSQKGLGVENAICKDPLVVIRDVLSYNSDDDILKSLKTQNNKVTSDIPESEYRAIVKYRRRARNPLESHVVLQVSPKLWQKLTTVGEVHIDLQRRTVADQTPLIQCTKCLGFGHGRKLCKESADLCSHCAGPHLRKDCPVWATGELPSCRNCQNAKMDTKDHGAFDMICPIRKRWDTLARSSVAYCC